jgi:hypothetical protein
MTLEEIREYIDKRLAEGSVDWKFYRKYGEYMSEEQIDKALDIGEDFRFLYEYVGHKFTPKNIDKALDKGKNLDDLYHYARQKFSPENIDKALDIGKHLWVLYKFVGHKFTPEQIEKAIEISNEDELDVLFNILREKRPDLFPDLFEVIKQYRTKQVIKQYPQAKYFDTKTYKVNRFIDALKIIRQDMLEER